MLDEEKDKDERDYLETAERDKLIYDSISTRYNLEWDRAKILDGKASGIISFVGIILALQSGIGTILIKDTQKAGSLFILVNGIFIISVLCLTISIIYGLKAYYIQKWTFVPEAHYLIEKYGKKERSRVDILRVLGQEMANSIDNNKNNNDKKKNFIIYGLVFLVVGLILNFFFIIGLVIVMSR